MRKTTTIKALCAAILLLGAQSCQPDIIFEDEGSNEDVGKAVADTGGTPLQVRTTEDFEKSKVQSNWPSYKVATLEYFPPFVMRDELRVPTGFDVDILNAIGEEQQFNLIFVPQTWDTCLPSLDSGARSLVATGVIMLPERVANYDFSDPYIESSYAAVLKQDLEGGAPKITNFDDIFKDPNRTYVTQRDTAGEAMLREHLDNDMSRVKLVDSQYDEIRYVVTGQADVAFDISIVLQYYIKKQNDKSLYYLLDPNSEVQDVGFALKKGNTELKAKIDEGLKAIKQNGKYDQIYQKWFGS